jgi:hypothetical protein
MSATVSAGRALFVCLTLTAIAAGETQTRTPPSLLQVGAGASSQHVLASLGKSPITPRAGETSGNEPMLTSTLTNLPLSFEPNRGQAPPDVQFLSRTPGYLLQLTATEMRLIVAEASEDRGHLKPPGRIRVAGAERSTAGTPKARLHAVRLAWVDANRDAEVTPESPLPGSVNYFKGSDPSTWRTNIPTFERVRCKKMYPGIDLVYYGRGRRLEYDLVVAPGANPLAARLALTGAEVSLTGKGDLDLTLSDGRRLQIRALVAYQDQDGERRPVEAHYRLARHGRTNEISFQVAPYDPGRPLIIDPVVYSTFLGGAAEDRAYRIVVNAAGEAFIAGDTINAGINFPTTPGAFSPLSLVATGYSDAFVAKLNAAGSALVYSTFLGGSLSSRAFDMAINAAGEAFVTGTTFSRDFPTTVGAFQTAPRRLFVTKLNAAGNALIYSTYLGGTTPGGGGDAVEGIVVNGADEAFVTGNTERIDFPTTPGAFVRTHNGPYLDWDAFVTRLNSTGTALVYSTYLGGSSEDWSTGIAVNAASEAFVVGFTYHYDPTIMFPTTPGAFRTVPSGPTSDDDLFVVKLNAAGSALVYSTLLGGSDNEDDGRIAVNAAGETFVTGRTFSSDFPTTAGAFSTVYKVNFVAKLNSAGSALIYSTFLGGSGNVGEIAGIAVTAADEALVIGTTNSTDFPTTAGALQTVLNGEYNAFVTKVNAAGSGLVYSTFLGGSFRDWGTAIAIGSACDVFVTGITASTDFPTTAGAIDTTHNGSADAFVAKISTCTCVPPPSDMVAWWPLDETAGATAVAEIAPTPGSTGNKPGIPQPGGQVTGPSAVSGQVNGALYFAGNYVQVPPHPDLEFGTGDLTIDAWIRPVPRVEAPNLSLIIYKVDGSGIGYALYTIGDAVGGRQLKFVMNGNTFTSNALITSPSWHHVAVTVDRGSSTPSGGFYIDGQPAGSFAPIAASVSNADPLLIGASFLPGLLLPGVGRHELAIDELEIFNRPLSPAEIRDIFNAGSAGKCKGPSGHRIGALGPAKVFVGLKHWNDTGLRIDLRAEVAAGSTAIWQGQLSNVSAGGAGFGGAVLRSVPLSLVNGPVTTPEATEITITLSARRTCLGGGPARGTARLWFDGRLADGGFDRDAGSRFGATIDNVTSDYFLRSGFSLSTAAGRARVSIDKKVTSRVTCPNREFTPFGTWRMKLP